ncbi:RidA family protein [Phenylobacterium sp. LH3H17]|uniref:RidA family protein n=1 Tax=Phenylobacterium sp. LH3H17 TaxID=2903901 RepID=UPI0020C9CAFE|nr:RidA family protein [Phenylobacterium sp. LH3H17]UTP41611.1 RidA family protein [Phenylobacterium sp. LH3H17]
MSSVEERLQRLGIRLPVPAAPVANYLPFVRMGGVLHFSGQLSICEDGPVTGVVGEDLDLETGRHAARLAGINLLAQMRIACAGNLDRVVRVVKLTGFVQAGPQFSEISGVINGCSDLMVEAFCDMGRHARSAVGVYRLPLNAAVEVDAIVEIN